MRRSMLLLIFAAIACGAPPASTTARPLYELGPMSSLAWLLGDWRSDAGSWHWTAAGDKVYGVAFDPKAFRQGFQVLIIEEERDPGHTQGVPWLHVYDGPESLVGVLERGEARLARFRQSMPEAAPFELKLSRGSDALEGELENELEVAIRRTTARRTLGPPERAWFRAYGGGPAPELERADRALAAAVNDSSDGSLSTSGATWAAAFAPDGAYWCERCVNGTAGRAAEAVLAPRNRPGRFDWVPIASRRVGDLGFTVGHMSYRPRLLPGVWRGTYLTVWRRVGADRWAIVFYTRRSSPATLPEPE